VLRALITEAGGDAAGAAVGDGEGEGAGTAGLGVGGCAEGDADGVGDLGVVVDPPAGLAFPLHPAAIMANRESSARATLLDRVVL